MQRKYKLLALDMDGTMLDSQKRVPSETLAAIARLISDGVCVTLATGRGLAELGDYSELTRTLKYGILLSGGMVYDFANSRPIYFQPLAVEDSLAILAQGECEEAMVHILTLHESVARGIDIENLADFSMQVYYDMYDRFCLRCDDLPGYVRAHGAEVLKINLYHRSTDSRDRSWRVLSKRRLTCTLAETLSLEMNPGGINKAFGLQKLCEHLHLSLADTVAVGDAPNDREILQAAGLAVAMGNADESIKRLADVVVADNDHNGVLETMNKFF